MAVAQQHQPSNTTEEQEQSVAVIYKSPAPHRRLPLKKRKFGAVDDAPFECRRGLNHKGDSESTSSFSSSGSIVVNPVHSSSEGVPGSDDDDSEGTTTHRQPVNEDFNSATSKKPRTGAVGKNFIKNYVMSRDYNALTSNSMTDFLQIKSVGSRQQQQSNIDFTQNKSVGSHQQGEIDFMQTISIGSHQQQGHQYRYKCKTCNKSFPTFRALGGHRSSHYVETKDNITIPSSSTTDENPIVTVVAGDHRCKICNKSFPTGRALGGHKRLHWKPFADSSFFKAEMLGKKKFDIDLKDNQIGGDDGINLELTL